jgi:hypothetical protein
MCDVKLLALDQGYQEQIWPCDTTVCPRCGNAVSQYRTSYMFDNNCNSKIG